SQTIFEDTLSQMTRASGAPQNNVNGSLGGTNPAQVGLGVRMAPITTNFIQGSAQTTGRPTDLMISGDGSLIVKSANGQLYTRAGAFSFDADGRLVTATGAAVQGWPAVGGSANTNLPLGDIQLPAGTLIAPKGTQRVTISGNLPADATLNTQIPRTIRTYDAQGNAVTLTATFQQVGVSPSSYQVTLSDNANPPNVGSAVPLVFADATTATPP